MYVYFFANTTKIIGYICVISIYINTQAYILDIFKIDIKLGKLIIILYSFSKNATLTLCEKINSPIQIFDLYRRYRNNRYNWAGCRLRDSGFISRFLKAGEQINSPTSMRSRPVRLGSDRG